jgi:hypothetical protein
MSNDNEMVSLPEDIYRNALQTAVDQWVDLQVQERRITIQKNQLRQTFLALFPLAYPNSELPDVSSMSLANAIRMVIGGADRPMTAIEMRGKLTDLGFDLTKYDNPLANIHTAMNRMVESDEMQWVDIDEKKAMPGPELKHVQPPLPAPTDDQLKNQIMELMSSMSSLNPTEEKK